MNDLMQQLRDSQLALLEQQTSLFSQDRENNHFHMPHLNPTQQQFEQQDVFQQAERLVDKIDSFASECVLIGDKIDAIMQEVQFHDFSHFQVAEEASQTKPPLPSQPNVKPELKIETNLSMLSNASLLE